MHLDARADEDVVDTAARYDFSKPAPGRIRPFRRLPRGRSRVDQFRARLGRGHHGVGFSLRCTVKIARHDYGMLPRQPPEPLANQAGTVFSGLDTDMIKVCVHYPEYHLLSCLIMLLVSFFKVVSLARGGG